MPVTAAVDGVILPATSAKSAGEAKETWTAKGCGRAESSTGAAAAGMFEDKEEEEEVDEDRGKTEMAE